ncbi:MAG TPA: LPS assembly lipoprotein LptE [Vicinamibacterales bacterium]
MKQVLSESRDAKPWRVLSANSPTGSSREKHLSRETRCGGRRGGPVRGHPRAALRVAPLLIIALLLQAACGYSLAGRGSFLPLYIKTIGVPQFRNLTSIPDVDRRVTDRVRSELIGRGKWVVKPDATDVDGLITGDIVSIAVAPAAFNAQQQATRYALILTARVDFKDVRANKILWSNPSMQYREEFDVTTATATLDATAFFGQDINALERMASEFARAVVSAILEAF